MITHCISYRAHFGNLSAVNPLRSQRWQEALRTVVHIEPELKGPVRLGKVVNSSGCESRSSKAGQPLDRELWVGGGNPKD